MVGVAGGLEKFSAIGAALLGGYIKILVVDQLTAEQLVRQP